MTIPTDIRQTARKYALGEYIIHPNHANNDRLEKWIKNIQFNQYETASNRMQLHSRKRNNLFTFHLDALDKDVVLKVSQISKHYRWHRKLNLKLVALFKDYSLNAFYGGIALEKNNVDSLKVIAHWTCKQQKQSKKSYLLYEKVDASMSVFDLCNNLSEYNSHTSEIIPQIAKSLARIIASIHASNIRHGDPHAGNFLLCSPLPPIKDITPGMVKEMRFTLIDLDKIHFSHHEKSCKKRLFDIRCIRRFYVQNIDSIQGLNYYLDRKPKLSERLILKFWMKGGFNIYKWVKPSKKRV